MFRVVFQTSDCSFSMGRGTPNRAKIAYNSSEIAKITYIRPPIAIYCETTRINKIYSWI